MKIKSFTAVNYKGIKNIDIKIEDNLLIIMGKNGAGKSSAIDGIKNLIAGKDKLIKRPIREGEDKAVLTCELDDYNIKRIFTDKTDKLEVTTKAGASIASPQALLNKLTGGKSFDPNEFAQKSEKEQRADLLKLVGLNIDEENEKRAIVFNKRRDVGVEGKTLAGYSSEEVKEAKENTGEEISVSGLALEINDAKTKREKFKVSQRYIEEKTQEMENLRIDIEALKEIKDTNVDIESMQGTLDKSEETNKLIRKSNEILANEEKVQAKREEYDNLTKEIETIDDIKKQLLEAVKLPVKGLTITDDGVFLNNIPLSQLSSSEKIRVGVLMYVFDKPELSGMFIKNGNDLDSEGLEVLRGLSEEHDVLIIIEKVSDEKIDGVGIFIEDGEIK